MKKKKMTFLIVFAGAIVVFLVGVVIEQIYNRTKVSSTVGHYMDIGGKKVFLEIADTEAKRTQGLSGRNPLAPNQGMLFVFPQVDYWGIWMKDMNFPIDILWLDEGFRVITAEENVSPNTYPQVFKPTAPSEYVLELPAGFIAKNNIVHLEQLKVY